MLAFALVLATRQTPPATREERVLELARALEHEGRNSKYPISIFELAPPPFGERAVVVASPTGITCGNSDEGTVAGAPARRAALELCAIFGLDVEQDRRVSVGEMSVALDGVDPVRKLGFDLRGLDDIGWDAAPMLEARSAALDDASEFAWLEAQGYRLFVADLTRFRKLDGDEFTGTFAFLAGLVEFLDDVTDGDDVDLGGLVFEREATWRWKKSIARPLPDGVRRLDDQNGIDFAVERPARIRVTCQGRSDLGPPPDDFLSGGSDRRSLTSSTLGTPSVLTLSGLAIPYDSDPPDSRPTYHLVVRQRRDGRELLHETDRFTAFLPSSFDLTQPFEIELVLTRGHYAFFGPARIGAAAPR